MPRVRVTGHPPPPRLLTGFICCRISEKPWTLYRQGSTGAASGQHVGVRVRTVQRDLRTATFPGRKQRSDSGHGLLDTYKAALLERWNAGCYTAMRLFRDLQPRGYPGSYG